MRPLLTMSIIALLILTEPLHLTGSQKAREDWLVSFVILVVGNSFCSGFRTCKRQRGNDALEFVLVLFLYDLGLLSFCFFPIWILDLVFAFFGLILHKTMLVVFLFIVSFLPLFSFLS